MDSTAFRTSALFHVVVVHTLLICVNSIQSGNFKSCHWPTVASTMEHLVNFSWANFCLNRLRNGFTSFFAKTTHVEGICSIFVFITYICIFVFITLLHSLLAFVGSYAYWHEANQLIHHFKQKPQFIWQRNQFIKGQIPIKASNAGFFFLLS